MSAKVDSLQGAVPMPAHLYRRGELRHMSSRLVEMPPLSDDSHPLPVDSPAGYRSTRIAIKAKGRIVFIYAEDVIAVEARGNYSVLLCTSSSYRLRESISNLESTLNAHGFLRIHRSVLINSNLVEEIQPWPTGEYALRVRGGREFTVTRTYRKNLHALAQLWIGTNGFVAGQ